MINDELEALSERQAGYGSNILHILIEWKTSCQLMPMIGFKGYGRMIQHNLFQRHVGKWDVLAQFVTELIGCKDVNLFGRILDLVQKTRDVRVKQRFTTRNEYLFWLQPSDDLNVKLIDRRGSAGLIELSEQWILFMGGAPGTVGVARIQNLYPEKSKHGSHTYSIELLSRNRD